MLRRLAIVGSDAAACLLAHTYRKLDLRCRVTVISSDAEVGFLKGALPYYSLKLIDSPLVLHRSLLTRVDLVDLVSTGEVRLEPPGPGAVEGEGPFDEVVFVNQAFAPPPTSKRPWFSMHNVETALQVGEQVLDKAGEVVVVDGLIAAPMIDALLRAGKRPVVCLGDHLAVLEPELQRLLVERLTHHGVRIVRSVSEAPPELPHISVFPERPGVHLDAFAHPGSVDEDYRPTTPQTARVLGLGIRIRRFRGLLEQLVVSEEELLLHAQSCAFKLAGKKRSCPNRYLTVWLMDEFFAVLGLNKGEAARAFGDVASIRIKGTGRWSGLTMKAISDRSGNILGIQIYGSAEHAALVGLLYHIVNSGANVSQLLDSLAPIDHRHPAVDDPIHRGFEALFRKVFL